MIEITGDELKNLKSMLEAKQFTPIYVTAAIYDGESAAQQFILSETNIISILRSNIRANKPDKYHKIESIAELREAGMNVYIEDFLKSACIKEATRMILQYGGIDGGHHKMWVLDQVLRILNLENYEAVLKESDPDDEFGWDTGIAP